MVNDGGGIVGAGRFFGTVKCADADGALANTNLSHKPPAFVSWAHPFGEARVSLQGRTPVARVLRSGAESKVLSAIVDLVSVDVVYLKAGWSADDDAMHEQRTSAAATLRVSAPAIRRPLPLIEEVEQIVIDGGEQPACEWDEGHQTDACSACACSLTPLPRYASTIWANASGEAHS